ncbi:hypothetical protein SJPD1_2468 [Sulfurospirillum diekertiae]|uniref:Porin domain-containing protein n=1 Tax=Sulfurospirillum diekertiae TaxID=1854492 RepID=A0A290HGB8_9BACT|nr:Opr family porin [Sulfurospirillum diekertiae]ATB70563.1 hypothetical protein SJPD1_2468 [Sulfurospirillum diekertiae]
MQLRYSHMIMAMVLGSSLSIASEATNLEEVFTQGKIESTLGWFGQSNNAKGTTADSGFSNGYLNVGFETAPLYGVSLGVSGWGSVKTSEKNDGDYKNAIADQSVLSQAYIKIEHDGMGKVVLGRQAVDFNWLTDYIEGATFEFKGIENLVFNMAWARKYSVVDIDEVSEAFSKLNNNNGIYMLDLKYTPIEALELNPYLYYGDNLLSAYGLKATVTLEPSEAFKTITMAHYVTINSDVVGTLDGSFAQVEQGVDFLGAKLALGYIKVNKDGMAGLGEFGDQLPFEEHNHTFDKDAKTPYISAAYEIEGIKLGAIYGSTSYLDETSGDKIREKELNLTIGYEIIKNLEASMIYANIDNDNNDESYNAIKAHIAYKF